MLRLAKRTGYVRTKTGAFENSGGTWFAPKLAVPFARWCDMRFAIWCDDQIGKILRGDHPYFNWKRERSLAAAPCKAMCEALQMLREEQAKETLPALRQELLAAKPLWAKIVRYRAMGLTSREIVLLCGLSERQIRRVSAKMRDLGFRLHGTGDRLQERRLTPVACNLLPEAEV